MVALLAVVCGVLGLLVGSFLNVVIWRVPRGESIVSPPSHCPGCDKPVRPYDNVPVLSWLVLRGRCRDCGERISIRYPVVELGCGVLFALLALHFGLDAALPAYLYLAAVGLSLALIDIDVRRLPNALTLPSYAVAVVLLAIASLVSGDWGALLRALIGMVALYGFYFVLAVVYPAGMGFGDVKLAGVLGLYLGYLGWGPLIVGGFFAFLLGGIGGVVVLALRKGTRKSLIPFGPYMILGALLAVLVGAQVAGAYVSATLG